MAAEAPLTLVIETEPSETAFFSVGSAIRLHVFSSDADTKQPVDPDTLTFTQTPPYTTPSTVALIHSAVGVNYVDWPLTAPGKWRGQFVAVLGGVQVQSSTIEVVAVQSAWW